MGRGISGAIPLKFVVDKWHLDEVDKSFLDCYNFDEESGSYTIKMDLLIDNFKAFFLEFYDTMGIDEDGYEFDWEKFDLLKSNGCTTSDFLQLLSEYDNTGKPPGVYGNHARLGCPLSVATIDVESFIYIYSGSYKAYLEEYTTFDHMESLTRKVIKNPLGKAVKYGIFG